MARARGRDRAAPCLALRPCAAPRAPAGPRACRTGATGVTGLREVRREEPFVVARLAPSERAQQHARQRGPPLADRAARARRRPSPACACRGWRRRRLAGVEPAQRLVRVRGRARLHAPLGGLQLEHAPVGRVVVDDEQALGRRAPAARRRSRDGVPAAASASGAAIVKWNVDPSPGPSLSAHMRPPISSASRLLIASPSPVPPYLRVVDESAWENDWNRRSIASARQADAGVAHGERELAAVVRPRGFAVTVSTTSPASVNFTALDSRLSEDLAQPRHVALDRRRHVALEEVREVEALLDGARGDEVERRLDALAQVERLRLDVHAPGLDLREVEDVVDDGEQRVAGLADGADVVALLGVERRVEQQAAHADHRVHRRADLVAHGGEERCSSPRWRLRRRRAPPAPA